MQVTRAATTRAGRWALGAVAVALFGLMSMHGWGSHSAQPFGGAADPAMHSSAMHSSASGSDVVLAAAGSASDEAAGAPGSGHGEDQDDGHGLVGLCLAVLVGLVLTALLLLHHRGVRAMSAWLPSWSLPTPTGRDRDPPDLLRLCVVRC